ncbi:RcnB family protein [Dyella psychrodurans]|nr:RcnB family protein [Dyella psychrodurans]
MKRFLTAVATMSAFAISINAFAAPIQDQDHDHGQGWGQDDHGHGHDDRDHDHGYDHDHYDHDHYDHDHGRHGGWDKHYGRGDRLPERYRGPDYYVDDYERYHLYAPRPGYRWVRGDDGQFVLVAVATGIIIQEVLYGH